MMYLIFFRRMKYWDILKYDILLGKKIYAIGFEKKIHTIYVGGSYFLIFDFRIYLIS